jgi:CRP-like cAMP-binding protein
MALSPEELETFHSLLKLRRVSKRSFLLQEGEVCDFEAFILKGCIRTYFIDENGYETILLFAVENWWVSDIASFSEQKPSRLFIEALEDSELLVIDHDRKEALFRSVPQFERLFRILVQRSLTELQHRYFDSISKTAKERYAIFLEKYPAISRRVPQQQIARYLGISPEFLSKIRGELLHKG